MIDFVTEFLVKERWLGLEVQNVGAGLDGTSQQGVAL